MKAIGGKGLIALEYRNRLDQKGPSVSLSPATTCLAFGIGSMKVNEGFLSEH